MTRKPRRISGWIPITSNQPKAPRILPPRRRPRQIPDPVSGGTMQFAIAAVRSEVYRVRQRHKNGLIRRRFVAVTAPFTVGYERPKRSSTGLLKSLWKTGAPLQPSDCYERTLHSLP